MDEALHATLWNENQDLAQACLHHPFVVGLGDGSLDQSAFERYVAQDAFFLLAFARAYARCASACQDLRDFRRFFELQGGVLEELQTHASFAAQMGINLEQVRPYRETQAYTGFLLETANTASLGDTVAAMTPCMRLYAYLGQSLASAGVPEHRYTDWIRAYCSDDFEELALVLEGCLDEFATDPVSARRAYRRAMECELAFFGAPLSTATPMPLEPPAA